MLNKIVLTLAILLAGSSLCQAAEYKLSIQPILPRAELLQYYQPLATYLSEQTGETISISANRNVVFDWHNMRKAGKNFDLVLDGAHFTGYRVETMGYTVLAKLPDTVSYALVTRDDSFILSLNELINKKVATLPSPSFGAVRLEQLFPNPMRIPEYVWETNVEDAIASVISGNVTAAIVPTRLVTGVEGLNTIMITDPVPHMGLSASPDVPAEVAEKIRSALLDANKTEKGRKMLAALKVASFEPTDNETYIPFGRLLKDVPGYIGMR